MLHFKNIAEYRAVAFVTALAATCICGAGSAQADDWKLLISPSNSFSFNILNGDKAVLAPNVVGWGPNWSWFYLGSQEKGDADQLSLTADIQLGNQKPKMGFKVHAAGTNQVAFEYDMQADTDVPVMMIDATVGLPAGQHGKAVLTKTDGSEMTVDMPVTNQEFGSLNKATLTSDQWTGPVTVTFDPPLDSTSDGDLRFKLAKGAIKAGSTKEVITYTFPSACALMLSQASIDHYSPVVPGSDWFAYQPQWPKGPSAIGMEDWMDKPAGKHGPVQIRGDHFEFTDGTSVKMWGVNLNYMAVAPEKSNADFTAARFAKYGINAVRLHNFSGPGWEGIGDPNDSTKFDSDGLDKFDYFNSKLAENGVYYRFSRNFTLKLKPADKARVAGYDEIMAKGGNTYAVMNWAEDVQDLLIAGMVNLVKHKNTYTGKTYAEDPALFGIEMQNEDDIFFFTTPDALANFPTYRKQLQAHFATWLTDKYGSQEKLATAWDGAIKPDESLAEGSVLIYADMWRFGPQGLSQAKGGDLTRLLDTAAFFHYTQDKFYTKYAKALREAGYKGPLLGSNWQAPAMLPHYYNLKSDTEVGFIERHDYFGGGYTDTMMKSPGGGFLSMGLQQVAGVPMGTSEWIDVYPSLYSAEGPVLLAAYGMGLQGWSTSYEFESNSTWNDPAIDQVGKLPWGVWNADLPTQVGQYPVLSRMLMRGDITTAPVISTRNISDDDLKNGQFNFNDVIQQQGDVKTFTGSVPAETLAAGRAQVQFVDQSAPSTLPDLTKYTDGKVITSATGQLKWDAGNGVVTIDTPGTQGYVGFAQGKSLVLGDVTIQSANPYASILLTAADLKNKIADDNRVLISAVARNSNAGFRVFTIDDHTIVDNGKGPIMLEPVKADITFNKRKIKQVNILDQDGNASGRTLNVQNGKFTIDGTQDHAIYYEVLLDQ